MPSFMTTSQNSDAIGVLKLKTEKKMYRLNRVVSTINEVAQKNVSRIRYLASLFKNFKQVVEMTMNLSNYCYWGAHCLNITLVNENLLELFANDTKRSFWKDPSISDVGKP